MLLSIEKRFVFVHIPKTAGQSISAALAPWAVKTEKTQFRRLLSHLPVREDPTHAWPRPHGTARWLRHKLPADMFDSYFKFAVVRNQFDFLVSYFHYLRQNETSRRHADALRWSFSEFLGYIGRKNRTNSVSQLSWITDAKGGMLVDDLLRFERLDEDFARVLDRIGLGGAIALPHVNRTQRKDYRDYYTARDRKLVETMFADDLRTLDYSF
ncbi:MAG: sulfotransferase family 2 domain-containing protein [Mesorhizobium sp.]|nr:sulfotransferase family 2 domain-containing protein [Mesorhizobium sp.]